MNYRTLLILNVILLSGCASKPPEELSEGPTMRDVINRHMGSSERLNGPIRRLGHGESEDVSEYTRDAYNETRNLFPRLPNPDLCFYIYPHSSQEGLPVPGYSSCIPMYEHSHYAMPGELGPQPISAYSIDALPRD
jgi:conjugative transfer region lipoprotein (TIGR03751 family)